MDLTGDLLEVGVLGGALFLLAKFVGNGLTVPCVQALGQRIGPGCGTSQFANTSGYTVNAAGTEQTAAGFGYTVANPPPGTLTCDCDQLKAQLTGCTITDPRCNF